MTVIGRCEAAWAEVDRLRATTVDREHFDRKIREWIALYDEEQAKRRAAESQLRGAVAALEHIAESAEHPSLTVRSTSYLGHVARTALDAIRGR